ncbi:hypothetical protein LXL04_031810 [Taraxacum kok-saghyz]
MILLNLAHHFEAFHIIPDPSCREFSVRSSRTDPDDDYVVFPNRGDMTVDDVGETFSQPKHIVQHHMHTSYQLKAPHRNTSFISLLHYNPRSQNRFPSSSSGENIIIVFDKNVPHEFPKNNELPTGFYFEVEGNYPIVQILFQQDYNKLGHFTLLRVPQPLKCDDGDITLRLFGTGHKRRGEPDVAGRQRRSPAWNTTPDQRRMGGRWISNAEERRVEEDWTVERLYFFPLELDDRCTIY